jgi:hypothetical protein
MGLVKGERIITDGTLIEANASIESMVSRIQARVMRLNLEQMLLLHYLPRNYQIKLI